jgi:hypothetical protein
MPVPARRVPFFPILLWRLIVEEFITMSMLRNAWSLVLLLVVVVGCATRESPHSIVADPPGRRAMKTALAEIAATGKLGTSIKVVKEQLQSMAEENKAKADQLRPDFDQLISLTDTVAIQAKAKEMADKL